MRIALVGILSVAMIGGSIAHAADTAAAKDKAEMCVGCHGDNGISQTQNIPSLAGQPDQFLQWQLVFFRGGSRKNEQMQPIAEAIGNEDVRALGAYFAALTPPKAATPDDNPDLFQEGRTGGGGAALRVLPYRLFRRHQGRGTARRPARGISGQGAARLQIGRADRWRRRRDDGCRLSPQRRGNPGARALSRASVNGCRPRTKRAPIATGDYQKVSTPRRPKSSGRGAGSLLSQRRRRIIPAASHTP